MERNFFGAHKQVVNQLGMFLIVTAWSSDSELIEALEAEYGAPIIGTQFHPKVTIHGLPPDAAHIGNIGEIEVSLKLFHFFIGRPKPMRIKKISKKTYNQVYRSLRKQN
ncbi:gamma-glutamyl-gamma-aminobutyrate hydrolase family protein [Legionella gresilensis]|uniref:gamma-glutamyl-gamma-aminobutyrate hydrolase family protein n=1 Tax=Legionella gresilensis TaxID=91823 RepID=UPI0010414EF8